MKKANHTISTDASRRLAAGLTHLFQIIAELDWLEGLRREALAAAERFGPLHGPIHPAARPWSRALEQIEAERQRLSA